MVLFMFLFPTRQCPHEVMESTPKVGTYVACLRPPPLLSSRTSLYIVLNKSFPVNLCPGICVNGCEKKAF